MRPQVSRSQSWRSSLCCRATCYCGVGNQLWSFQLSSQTSVLVSAGDPLWDPCPLPNVCPAEVLQVFFSGKSFSAFKYSLHFKAVVTTPLPTFLYAAPFFCHLLFPESCGRCVCSEQKHCQQDKQVSHCHCKHCEICGEHGGGTQHSVGLSVWHCFRGLSVCSGSNSEERFPVFRSRLRTVTSAESKDLIKAAFIREQLQTQV